MENMDIQRDSIGDDIQKDFLLHEVLCMMPKVFYYVNLRTCSWAEVSSLQSGIGYKKLRRRRQVRSRRLGCLGSTSHRWDQASPEPTRASLWDHEIDLLDKITKAASHTCVGVK